MRTPTPAEFDAALEVLGAEPPVAAVPGQELAIGFNTSTNSGTSYHGGSIEALTRNWLPRHRSGDDALRDSAFLLHARIEDLIRNEPSLEQAARVLVKHIIGKGITTFAAAQVGRDEDEEFNDESDLLFDEFAELEIDAEGKHAWPEMQWHLQEQTIIQGDGILLECMDNRRGRSVPICWQQLEADQLDTTKNYPAGADGNENRIVRGVELDRRNRAVAYWIWDAHPYDSSSGWTALSSRVPAARVTHYFVPFGKHSMTRGVSWFHALVRATRDADWFVGSELTAAALGALLVMVHKAEKPTQAGLGFSDLMPGSDQFGNPQVKLGPGIKATIGINEEIEIAESVRPSKQVGPFMQFIRQEQAMGTGLSYISFTGDYSNTSFSSAHGAINDESAYIEPLQGRVARRVVCPVRRRWTEVAAGYGLFRSLSPAQFVAQRRRWQRLTYMGPGRRLLDPNKQREAATSGMRAALSDLIGECAAEGRHWKTVIRNKAKVEAYARKMKTTLDWSKGASAPDGAAADEILPAGAKPAREPVAAGAFDDTELE